MCVYMFAKNYDSIVGTTYNGDSSTNHYFSSTAGTCIEGPTRNLQLHQKLTKRGG